MNVHFTLKLTGGGEVRTTEIQDEHGRSHWFEQFTDKHGMVEAARVLHPYVPAKSDLPRSCELTKAATLNDAIECVETHYAGWHPGGERRG